jgi:hypothetical protein
MNFFRDEWGRRLVQFIQAFYLRRSRAVRHAFCRQEGRLRIYLSQRELSLWRSMQTYLVLFSRLESVRL